MDFYALLNLVFLMIMLGSIATIFCLVSGYGGEIGKSLKIIGWGSILMGTSHFLETISTHILNISHDIAWLSSVYHFLATLSVVIIAYGFKALMTKK